MTRAEEPPILRFPDGSGRSLKDVLAAAPPEAVVELAPGRYSGPIVITKPVSLRGAGDLTRVSGERSGSVLTVRAPKDATVVLDSLLLEDGQGESGGGVLVHGGTVRLHNVHVQRCDAAGGSGGAIHVSGGSVEVSLLRVHDTRGDRGGALSIGGRAMVHLRDSQIRKAEARLGGALAVFDMAMVVLESVTIAKTHATSPAGGQAIYVSGAQGGVPALTLRRVRLEDAPMGMPLVVDPAHPGEVGISGCDMPRVVLSVPGVIDGGDNLWR